MKRPWKPAVRGPKLEERHGRTGISHCRGEVKSEQQAAAELDQQRHQHQTTKAVKQTNVRRDVFSCRSIEKGLSFEALLEPIEGQRETAVDTQPAL
jgi:hypothetical protein